MNSEPIRETAVDHAAAHPTLAEDQIATLRQYGHERTTQPGEVLFQAGDASYDFFVVLEGSVEVIEDHHLGEQRLIACHTPGNFAGGLNLLSGQVVQFRGVMPQGGRLLVLKPQQIRAVVANEPALSELILRAFLLRRAILMSLGAGLQVLGSRFDPTTREMLQFLARSRVPVTWVELENNPDAEALLQQFEITPAETPVVVSGNGEFLRRPSLGEVAILLGLDVDGRMDNIAAFDLVVIGAGPAGLASAVYGSSEGLNTLLLDSTAVGGQAGTSSRIENYLGFPAGVSGEELAERASLQAAKFGTRIVVPRGAKRLTQEDGLHILELDDGSTVQSRAVIIATGARYRRLPLERLEEFEGAGVYYAATQAEAQMCASGTVVVVGGGNSAGQAAIYLADHCKNVYIVIRRDSLDETMSRYLIDQIDRHPSIKVETHTEVDSLHGEGMLESVTLRTGDHLREVHATGVFLFIGADPCTTWLDGQLAEDDGFLLTGKDIPSDQLSEDFVPSLLETSRAGVFCAGDARYGSMKRVASATGEGAMAVRFVHEYLSHP